MIKIAPSLLAADFSRLADEIKRVADGGADMLHVDVMDGHFVPNITIGPFIVEAIRRSTDLFLDVHLMIDEPDRYAGPFADAGASRLSFHCELDVDGPALAQRIREQGALPGAAISPATPSERLDHLYDSVDGILVMTVEPGFGGQEFMPGMLPKIARIREQLETRGRETDILVDGGISTKTAPLVCRAGANVLVAGTAVFGASDVRQAIERLRGAGREACEKT